MTRIKVGDVFGDFSLKSHTEAVVDTAALAGKKILLVFSSAGLDGSLCQTDAVAGGEL